MGTHAPSWLAKGMADKPRLAVVSHVLPYPGSAGQQQRVAYKLRALRPFFHLTFITTAPEFHLEATRLRLLKHCDEAVVASSVYTRNDLSRLWYRSLGAFFTLRTGLKFSNYLVGKLEFSPARLELLLGERHFDCALYEYWHAAESTSVFHRRGAVCILDMHDLLWQSYRRQLDQKHWLPGWGKSWAVRRYREQEEQAWSQFDGLIAISQGEYDYMRQRLPSTCRLFFAPMGLDLRVWPYSWQPANPPRIAYYGGLGSSHNQRDALYCYKQIMPLIWDKCPEAELWLVGSHPPKKLLELTRDPRVHVTGYVEQVQETLKSMLAVLCPWAGTYGFRSRLVEVMALGVPVVASPDAVHGMDLSARQGLWLAQDSQEYAEYCLNIIKEPEFAREQSLYARAQIMEKFSFDATYGHLAEEILAAVRRNRPS